RVAGSVADRAHAQPVEEGDEEHREEPPGAVEAVGRSFGGGGGLGAGGFPVRRPVGGPHGRARSPASGVPNGASSRIGRRSGARGHSMSRTTTLRVPPGAS